jgi:hypothetical protein
LGLGFGFEKISPGYLGFGFGNIIIYYGRAIDKL